MDNARGNVYIVDDDPAICRASSAVLASVGYAVKSYSTGDDFLRDAIDQGPHCVLVDLILPGMPGLKLCQEIVSQRPSATFIVVTGNGDTSSAVQAMRLGAIDFLEKPVPCQRLLDCVHRALQLAESRHRHRINEKELLDRLALLTVRERDVFDAMAAGLATKEIAARRGLSSRTIDGYRSRVMQKLQIDCAMHLAQFIAVLSHCAQ
jgi:FixJ family two-component response regulator